MTAAFDTVEEFWDRSDALSALDAALEAEADPVIEFEDAFARYIGGLDAAFLISGREATYQVLQILDVNKHDEVILPAFECQVVAEAVLRANATPVLVDVELPSGQIDLTLVKQAVSSRTKAVLIPHLYGVPVDFTAVSEELDRRGIAVIEDCAHTLGGTVNGSTAGSLGAFSIFSFNFDKPISLGNGGMLVCSDSQYLDAFRRWKSSHQSKPKVDAHDEFQEIEEFLGYLTIRRSEIRNTPLPSKRTLAKRLLSRSRVARWLRGRLRSLKSPVRQPAFGRVAGVRAALGLSMLQRYPMVAAKRNRNATHVLETIGDLSWGRVTEPPSNVTPQYLRLNVFAEELSPYQVDCVAAKLCQAGFRSGRLNWGVSLDQLFPLSMRTRQGSRIANAPTMAGHCLNLPIHQNMSANDLDRMISVLVSAVGDVLTL